MLTSNALTFFTVDIYKPTQLFKKLRILRTNTLTQNSSIVLSLKALLGLFHQEVVNSESGL